MASSQIQVFAQPHPAGDAIHEQINKVSEGSNSDISSYDDLDSIHFHHSATCLVLVVSSLEDLQLAKAIIQNISLKKYHQDVVLVASSETDMEAEFVSGLSHLESFVSHLFLWPRDKTPLSRFIRNHQPKTHPDMLEHFRNNPTEYLIAKRLVEYTPSLLPLVEKLALASEHDVTVLLTGQTGTGKTYLSRLIHDFSPRHKERFLPVPCGAIAPNLVESELFGHVKGSFTGADRDKIGKFEAAGYGTLLLDEIDELPLDQQANLLRVVETGEFERVGCTTTRTSNCRLIVASNLNLKEAVEKGTFRQDLYYRFNVMAFHLPPLRERLQDIEPLIRGMTARYASKFSKDLFEISSETIAALEAYPWPGNLRELENAIQHAVLISHGSALLLEHLPETIQNHVKTNTESNNDKPSLDTLQKNRELIERNAILRALEEHDNSRAKAADALGISRVTLYKKMKKYGLLKQTVQAS